MKRWTMTVVELAVAVVTTVAAWAWASGVTPGEVLDALRRTLTGPPARQYDVIQLGWQDLSSVHAISDTQQAVGIGRVEAGFRIPLAWQSGETTVCADGSRPGRAVAVDELGRVACNGMPGFPPIMRSFVLLPGGEQVQLQTPAREDNCRADDMNCAGVAVGVVSSAGGPGRACVWNAAGEVTVLDDRPSRAVGITDGGVIAGFVARPPVERRPCLWVPVADGYRLVDLREEIGSDACPAAINNAGVMVGTIADGEPFRWDASRGLRRLPPVDRGLYAAAMGINDRGEIVGFGGSRSVGGYSALLWCAAGRIDLNECIDPACGWHLLRATAINNRGMIGCDALRDDRVEAVLLVPRAGA